MLETSPVPLTDRDFDRLRKLIYRWAGLALSPAKKPTVAGRLRVRLRQFDMDGYGPYVDLLESDRGPERQVAIDLLTTNETHFFRESRHFRLLQEELAVDLRPPLRAWSAACSSGEEPYTLAMILADRWGIGGDWEILATDISTRVLAKARSGIYPMTRASEIPDGFLRRYWLKGIGSQQGSFRVGPELARKVEFERLNLIDPLPEDRVFDIAFLRNVLIYFEAPTKQHVVRHVIGRVKRGGLLFVGHSEGLQGLGLDLEPIAPAVYRVH